MKGHYDEIKNAIEKTAGIPVSYVEDPARKNTENGAYIHDLEKGNRIEVKPGMSQEDTLKTLVYLTAYHILQTDRLTLPNRKEGKRIHNEVMHIANTVCERFEICAPCRPLKRMRRPPASSALYQETANDLVKKIEAALR